MNGIRQTTIFEKGRITINFWKSVIENYMKSKKHEDKKAETPEVKKSEVSKDETLKLERELNQVELDIIKNIFNPMELFKLNKKKEEILNKLGRDINAPWKK